MCDQRQTLAQIARLEANLQLRGDANKGGPAIEKYLSTLRPALATRPGTRHLAEPSVGYDWCGAFVYYCCQQAGFHFSGRPSEQLPGTFAAVFIWKEWALLPENQFYRPPTAEPQPGDIVLFDYLTAEVQCDHIGVVIAVTENSITTAEGNIENQSGIFERRRDKNINGYIRIVHDS